MGIKKLFKVPVPDTDKVIGDLFVTIDDLGDSSIGVDALILLNQCLNNGPLLKDDKGRLTLHIKTLVSKMMNTSNKQLFVFDNYQKDESKEKTVNARANYKSEVFESITMKQAIKDFKDVLTLLNVPYVTAPPKVEAENYLVELKRMGLIDYILTTDTDVLAYGCDMLMSNKKGYKIFKIKSILKALKLDIDHFRIMCCLLGNDFNAKVKGITHLRILNNLNHVLDYEMNYSYVLFSSRVLIIHKRDQLEPRSPTFNKAIIDYLKERSFSMLVTKLEAMI